MSMPLMTQKEHTERILGLVTFVEQIVAVYDIARAGKFTFSEQVSELASYRYEIEKYKAENRAPATESQET